MSNRRRNTQNFKPDYREPKMRVKIGDGNLKYFNQEFTENDVVIIPNLFSEKEQYEIYHKLLDEISKTDNIDDLEKLDDNDMRKIKLFKSWHENSHFIADDKYKPNNDDWKSKCPIFQGIINRISEYFDADIKATRFNWYRNNSEWKPYHHDAAAVKKDKANKQNLTVGISFGFTREISFQNSHVKSNYKGNNFYTVNFPLPNCYVYAFGKNVNINWKHGIPQIKNKNKNSNDDIGRISIIGWGKNKQI